MAATETLVDRGAPTFTELRTERKDFDIYREAYIAFRGRDVRVPNTRPAPWLTRTFGETKIRVDSEGRDVGKAGNVILMEDGDFPEFNKVVTSVLSFKRGLELDFPESFTENGQSTPAMSRTILRAVYMAVNLVTSNPTSQGNPTSQA